MVEVEGRGAEGTNASEQAKEIRKERRKVGTRRGVGAGGWVQGSISREREGEMC